MQYRKARSLSNSKITARYKSTTGIAKPTNQLPNATPTGSAIPRTTTMTQNSGAHFPTTICLTEILPVGP